MTLKKFLDLLNGTSLFSWCIKCQLDDDTWERLQRLRLPGESNDELIMRVLRYSRSTKPS